jgi:hypothetical protein
MSAETVFADLLAELSDAGAVGGTMFGARALMLQKKAFACLSGDRIALKLGAGTPEHAEALAQPDAELWDPSGVHRPFKDWVAVLVDDNSELEDTALAELAPVALQRLALALGAPPAS